MSSLLVLIAISLSVSEVYSAVTCGDTVSDFWQLRDVSLELNVTKYTNLDIVTISLCNSTFDTILELYDSSGITLIVSDDDGCDGSTIGQSQLIITGLSANLYIIKIISKDGPDIEGQWELQIICSTPSTAPSSNPTSQYPTSAQTQSVHDACYLIDGDPPCNDPYYVNNLGCNWDNFDLNCMCIARDNNINVIYLIDISLSASPTQSDFTDVAALLQDVTDSTLILRNTTTTIYNQYILYNENQYVLPEFTDATKIDIDICCGARSQLNDVSAAIDVALQQFHNLNDNRGKVLVIFSGQQQDNYLHDRINICPTKSALENEGIFLKCVPFSETICVVQQE